MATSSAASQLATDSITERIRIAAYKSLYKHSHTQYHSTLFRYYSSDILLHFALVVDDAKCIVVTRVCLSVCLSAAVRQHYCTDPDVTWGHGRGCPLVVHYWVDLQSGHGLRCYGNNANPSYKFASIPRYDDLVRTTGWAGSVRAAGR